MCAAATCKYVGPWLLDLGVLCLLECDGFGSSGVLGLGSL